VVFRTSLRAVYYKTTHLYVNLPVSIFSFHFSIQILARYHARVIFYFISHDTNKSLSITVFNSRFVRIWSLASHTEETVWTVSEDSNPLWCNALSTGIREGPATGHLDTGFSWFPYFYKRMLRWFPSFQVATACFSCSPPDLNFLVTFFFHIFYT